MYYVYCWESSGPSCSHLNDREGENILPSGLGLLFEQHSELICQTGQDASLAFNNRIKAHMIYGFLFTVLMCFCKYTRISREKNNIKHLKSCQKPSLLLACAESW